MPTETASTRPFTQCSTPAVQRSPFWFPAAHTRIVFSAVSAWARAAIVSEKFARRSSSA